MVLPRVWPAGGVSSVELSSVKVTLPVGSEHRLRGGDRAGVTVAVTVTCWPKIGEFEFDAGVDAAEIWALAGTTDSSKVVPNVWVEVDKKPLVGSVNAASIVCGEPSVGPRGRRRAPADRRSPCRCRCR